MKILAVVQLVLLAIYLVALCVLPSRTEDEVHVPDAFEVNYMNFMSAQNKALENEVRLAKLETERARLELYDLRLLCVCSLSEEEVVP